jgi:hypothetical protein
MTEAQTRWPGFGYVQVPGLANRHISRYLRTQRKNMRRFFQERGLYVLADRMNQIRKSRQGMLAKNLMFQKVLNSYAQQTMPTRAGVLEPQAQPMHDVRQDTVRGVEESEPGESGIEVHGVAEGEPAADTGDLV